MLKYRNYDSTASLDAFCVEEGINSLNIDDGQGIEDISSIIDTGEKTLITSLISVSESFYLMVICYIRQYSLFFNHQIYIPYT